MPPRTPQSAKLLPVVSQAMQDGATLAGEREGRSDWRWYLRVRDAAGDVIRTESIPDAVVRSLLAQQVITVTHVPTSSGSRESLWATLR